MTTRLPWHLKVNKPDHKSTWWEVYIWWPQSFLQEIMTTVLYHETDHETVDNRHSINQTMLLMQNRILILMVPLLWLPMAHCWLFSTNWWLPPVLINCSRLQPHSTVQFILNHIWPDATIISYSMNNQSKLKWTWSSFTGNCIQTDGFHFPMF